MIDSKVVATLFCLFLCDFIILSIILLTNYKLIKTMKKRKNYMVPCLCVYPVVNATLLAGSSDAKNSTEEVLDGSNDAGYSEFWSNN